MTGDELGLFKWVNDPGDYKNEWFAEQILLIIGLVSSFGDLKRRMHTGSTLAI